MFGDISFVTVTVCSFIPVVGFIAINYDKIANYLIKSLSYYPGEGEIYRKNNPKLKTNNFFIRNPEHDYRLNYIKTPSFDTSVCLFNVYLFVIEEGIIDFRKVFKDYEKEIEDHESDNF